MTRTIDPIATSEVVRGAYQRYLRSLLAVRDPAIAAGLDAQITADSALTKGPLLEITPAYASGRTLDALVDEGVVHPRLRDVSGRALPFDRKLYQHQEDAIRKVVAGRNVVVATGTGSGKTECFLIPILNELSRQAAAGELTPGVRALLLYPMNALANDQVKRLRALLQSTPHITFGRYTGDTKHDARRALESFAIENPGQKRIPNELLSREEMRAEPPHILLTNYAMLEYLLLRPLDVDLFEGQHAGTWRFLVVDEAHVYDGAKGAELAMLLRRLVERVGAARPLQCIATSATVGGQDRPSDVTRFAQELFAVPFEYSQDSGIQDLVRATTIADAPGEPWGPLADEQYASLVGDNEALLAAAQKAGCKLGEPGRALTLERRMHALKALLAHGPLPLVDVAARVFPDREDQLPLTTRLVELGASTRDSDGAPALSARYHLFARATEGAFTCLSDAGPHVSLSRHERCDMCSAAVFEFGGCKRCGTVHLAGRVDRVGSHSVFRARKSLGERPQWLALSPLARDGDEDDEILDEQRSQDVEEALLCANCGALYVGARTQCDNSGCSSAELRVVQRTAGASAELRKCVSCGGRGESIVRLFESGNDAAVAVLATALYQELPAVEAGELADKPGEGRKLLFFSDSRQSAAYFAPYLEDSYGALQRRRLVLQGLAAGDTMQAGLRSDDLVPHVIRAADSVSVFQRRDSSQLKQRHAGLWVHREMLSLDERISLEGLGLVRVSLEREPHWTAPSALRALGLDESESWVLLEELVRTLKAQGAVTTPDDVDASDDAFEPRRGPIWIRETGSEAKRRVLSWMPTRGSNRRVDYLAKVLATLEVEYDPLSLLSGVWRLLSEGPQKEWLRAETRPVIGAVRRLDHTWLHWHLVGSEDEQHRCDRCGRVAAAAVRGVCSTTGCEGTMRSWQLPAAHDTNHYRVLYRSMLPVPMRVQEHTAQWSNEEASRIQQQFIDGDLNALSCSTTFELGVDVGDLQSVVLRNMPPTTANYVQRAGRAGRRTDSAALVLTYAQRRSHDLTRFAEPERMIAGEVRAPFIPLGNVRIDRRHAHSVALAAFFRHQHAEYGTLYRTVADFFSAAADGSIGADLVVPYLTPCPARVQSALTVVLPDSVQLLMGLGSGEWVAELGSLLADARDELRQDIGHFEARISEAVDSKNFGLATRYQRAVNTLSKRELLGFLATRNVLPKYGFPVDSVELRTASADSDHGQKLELSRDLTAAIYEYAPGAEIVAGGYLWQSGGVYRLPNRELLGKHYVVCTGCGLYRESDDTLQAACPACAKQAVGIPKQYVVPSFGFVASKGERKRPGQRRPRRAWNGATYVVETGTGQRKRTVVLSGGELTATSSERGELIAISHGSAGAGFLLCAWCGWGTSYGIGPIPKSHQRLVGKDGACTGPLELRSLAHKFQTDVLEIRLDSVTSAGASQTALISTLYAVIQASCDHLEISRDDIDGALHQAGAGITTLVIFDVVPGGAGHVGQIEGALEDVLVRAHAKVASCECGAETSCYRCLRVFRNERFHDDLCRGAARDLLARLLGTAARTAQLPRLALDDVPRDGNPEARFLLEGRPWEVFERAQPGQLDLYAGRTCIGLVGARVFVGHFEVGEQGVTIHEEGVLALDVALGDFHLIAAAV